MNKNKKILEIKESVDSIDELVKIKFNCKMTIINTEGDIYIADPQWGHWLSESEKLEFIEWVELRRALETL